MDSGENMEILMDLFGQDEDYTNFEILEHNTAPQKDNSRFKQVSLDDVNTFLENQQNANTRKKTEQDMAVFKQYLRASGEHRLPEVIPPIELNNFIGSFLLSVRKKNGDDFEPTSLRSFLSSIDRYMKQKLYPVSIVNDFQFSKCREVLKLKQKQLKGLGKGNKPCAADEMTDVDLDELYKSNVLGRHSPSTLVHSLWLVCGSHFGMRPGKETHDLRWGDIELKKDLEKDTEYIIYTQERQTKTRTGVNPRDVRKVKPRAYAIPEDEHRDPVGLYKLYREKRPETMNSPDAPFFLGINYDANLDLDTSRWYKNCAMGINKMYGIMKGLAEKAGLKTGRRLTNYSVRNHLVQKLSDSGVPPNQIVQITGHKNVNSLNNYSKINAGQNHEISNILSGRPELNHSDSHYAPIAPPMQQTPRSAVSSNSSLGKDPSPHKNINPATLFGGNTTFHGSVNFHFHGSQMSATSSHVMINRPSSVSETEIEHHRHMASPTNSPAIGERRFKRIQLLSESDSE